MLSANTRLISLLVDLDARDTIPVHRNRFIEAEILQSRAGLLRESI